MANLRGTSDEDPEYLADYLQVEGSVARERLEASLQEGRDQQLDPEHIKKLDAAEAKARSEGQMWPGWGPIELDPGIATIVTDLADAGYITTYSCEGKTMLHPHAMCRTAEIGLAGLLSDLTKERREEIKSIIEETTSVPFRLKVGWHGWNPRTGHSERLDEQLYIQFSRPLT